MSYHVYNSPMLPNYKYIVVSFFDYYNNLVLNQGYSKHEYTTDSMMIDKSLAVGRWQPLYDKRERDRFNSKKNNNESGI